ncbi:MAG: hypothetical protein ACXAC5_01995 [Promethearchaeota archaeon]|jgi:hypothetical protein
MNEPIPQPSDIIFTWPGQAMFLSGWADQEPDIAPDIDAVIIAAQKTGKKVGGGWQYRFQCTRAEAAEIERLTRSLGGWLYPTNKRDRRVLVKAADRVKKALAT